jgi:hypothetical protein
MTLAASETNGEAVDRILNAAGIEEAPLLRFDLPDGSRVIVRSDDDPFLNEPYLPETKIVIFPSAQAGAPVKMAGDYWLVHQNDPDDVWPSDFHAHNQTRPETLDCYTGEIYDPRSRKRVRKYNLKKLNTLLSQLPDRVRQ